MLQITSLLVPVERARRLAHAKPRSSDASRDTDNRFGLSAFVDAAVFCEEPARVSYSRSHQETKPPSCHRSTGRTRLVDWGSAALPSRVILGWAILASYLVLGTGSYAAHLAGLPLAWSWFAFVMGGGLLTLALCFAAYAVLGDRDATGEVTEEREVEAMDQDSQHLDALISEALDAVQDQPAPDPGILALKKESLQTLLHVVERRLSHMELHGADYDQQRQKLANLREQLDGALSLTEAQETQHPDLDDAVRTNRRRRIG